jgi:hypothetical protein
LYFLAAHKFGAFDPKDTMPFWADKRFTNESLENVSITKLSSERRPRKNTYGVPSGTPEYLKRYRDANKDRVKKYHQTYYRKMRSAYLAAQSAEPSTTPILDNSFAKLLEILPVSPDEPKE